MRAGDALTAEQRSQLLQVAAEPLDDVCDGQSRTVKELAGVTTRHVILGDADGTDSVTAAAVTPSFLPMLRVRVAIGRGFTSEDAHDPSQSGALISHARWQQQYARAADVLGKTIPVNGLPRTIIGVVPADLDIPILSWGDRPDIWLPLDVDAARSVARVYARLEPGATSTAAAREAQSFFAQLPDPTDKGVQIYATTAQDQVDAAAKRAIEILFITVARRVRTGLVVIEIALSLSFLIAASLLVRSLVTLADAPIGNDPHGLFAVEAHFGGDSTPANLLAAERHLA